MSLRISNAAKLPPHLRLVPPPIKGAPKTGSGKSSGKSGSKRKAKPKQPSKLEAMFRHHLQLIGCDLLFEREARFHPVRRWRLDFYSPAFRLAVELHGAVFRGGRHTSGRGFTEDREKMNAAAELGISVLEYTTAHLKDGSAIRQVQRMLVARGWSGA